MEIRIPNLGEGADSGAVVSIFVKEGDRVTKDQTLVELENEKAVAPIPSPIAGVVKKIYVKVGDKVTVGQAILSIDEESGTAAATSSPSQAVTAAEPKKATEAEGVAAPPKSSAEPLKAVPTNSEYKDESKSGLPPPASPTVRKIAKDLGIDLTIVRGTEAGGRISIDDLKTYIAGLKAAASQSQPLPVGVALPKAAGSSSEKIDFSKWGGILKKPVSSLRQKIAAKMVESWTTIPHVTQFDEADITALMAIRKKYAARYEKKGVHLTLTPLVMKAVFLALKKYPVVNSSFDEEARIAIEVITGESSSFENIVIPAVVFTEPEMAWAGLTETQAREKGIAIKVARFPMAASGRALTSDKTDGFTKLIIEPESERILGMGIVGTGAGELISEGVLAIEMGATAQDLAAVIHPHPTLSETLMESAEAFYGYATHISSKKS